MGLVETETRDRGTVLAEERTDLAVHRTLIAGERTLMAQIRPALSMIGFGFSIYTFFQYLPEEIAAGNIQRPQAPRNLGTSLIALGTLSLLAAAWQRQSLLRQVGALHTRHVWSISFVVAIAVVLIGFITSYGSPYQARKEKWPLRREHPCLYMVCGPAPVCFDSSTLGARGPTLVPQRQQDWQWSRCRRNDRTKDANTYAIGFPSTSQAQRAHLQYRLHLLDVLVEGVAESEESFDRSNRCFSAAFSSYRFLTTERFLGSQRKALQIGLEFLIAAGIIRTVTIEPTREGIVSLGLLIGVRTFLSWSIRVEIEGCLLWQVARSGRA